MGDDVRQDETGMEPDGGLKKFHESDEGDTEGHGRMFGRASDDELGPDGARRPKAVGEDDAEGHLARSKVSEEIGPDGMKKAKGFDEDTEGHVRLRRDDELGPDRLKIRGYGEDTEGHMRVRESDGPEMEPEGLSNHPRVSDDDQDAEGHLRR